MGPVFLFGTLSAAVAVPLQSSDGPTYPAAPRRDTTEVYFGAPVADPYRWLEELDSAETNAWVKAQNALSKPFLEGLPLRSEIRKRLEEVWNYERFGTPRKEGDRYFYLRNDGLQDQSVLFVADDLDANGRALIDPSAFSDDGTVAMGSYQVSPDGAHVAYSKSDGGTDWKTWRIRVVDSGEDLDEELRHTKFTGVAWMPDGESFFYSRYPAKGDESDGDSAVAIYRHELGTPQSADTIVYELPDDPRHDPYAEVTEDGRLLVVHVAEGFNANAIHVLQLGALDEPALRLLDEWDALYSFLGDREGELFFFTTQGAPRGRVIAVRLDRADKEHWREIIPERETPLEDAAFVGGRFLAHYLKDAKSQLAVYGADGKLAQRVALPGVGSVSGLGGRGDDPETFFTFTSFTTPQVVFHYDVDTGEKIVFRRAEVAIDTEQFETRQVFFESADRTRVPMFIVHRRGLKRERQNPTLLYGYGGFNISLTPSFSPARLVWLERGGVIAIPNLRGGGEYGEEWHLAGTKLEKQNVFDDFIAAAEFLIAGGYTSTEKLAIRGGSNGGLLVGAAMTQRPELFAAALPAVGVLDMLRYHTASANAYQWSSDYGTSEDEAQYKALRAYSPYHNVEPKTCYPPTLVTTADHDDRVVPWHSYKFGAELQHAQGCDEPILVRVETRAGHGAGKPTWMQIEEVADRYAFLARFLGMETPK